MNRLGAARVVFETPDPGLSDFGTSDIPDSGCIQAVERSPEKAGVGGSIPSLATIISTSYTAWVPSTRV
jgi:hypothetical protein